SMYDDQNDRAAEFLTDMRDLILRGESVYGPPDGPVAREKLAELDARIGLARELGEIAPAPPSIEQQVRQERLDHAFPAGDPREALPKGLATFLTGRLDDLAALGARELRERQAAVAQDVGWQATPATIRHSMYRAAEGNCPNGPEIVAALVADAEP